MDPDLQRRINNLSPQKRALFEAELKKRVVVPKPAVDIPIRSDTLEFIPLTHSQESIWYADQLQPGTPLYNIPLVMRFPQRLDIQSLDFSLTSLVDRHDSLRLTFLEYAGEPRQKIGPPFSPQLNFWDLRREPRPAAFAVASSILDRVANVSFDLRVGPLFHASVIALADEDWIVSLVMHHLVADAWSLVILESELRTLLAAARTNGPTVLPKLPLQFADYAVWQRSTNREPDASIHRQYWVKQLEGAVGGIDLPVKPASFHTADARGGMELFRIDATTALQVKEYASSLHATPFMVLLAAYVVFLYRHSRQRDMVVFSPIADRRTTQTEPIVGLLLNLLVLRIIVEPHTSFADLVANVRQTVLAGYEHQAFPPKVPRVYRSEHGVRATFGLQSALEQKVAMTEDAGASSTATWSKFDFSMILAESTEGYAAAIEYRSALFNSDMIRRWGEQFTRLLHAAVNDPPIEIAHLSWSKPAERAELIEWGTGACQEGSWSSLPTRISSFAASQPDALAVRADCSLTYRQLNAAAGIMAARLVSYGLKRGDVVAVILDRSPEWIVSFLSILKCGGIYLPLDPEYPADRIEFMLTDSAAVWLVTNPLRRSKAGDFQGTIVEVADAAEYFADHEGVALSILEAHALDVTLVEDDVAYQIYTSGSTGRPKAARLTHGGLSRLADAQMQVFSPRSDDRILQFASLSFDASIFEITLALAHGAELCLAHTSELLPGSALAVTLAKTRTTLLTIPPTLLAALPHQPFPDLRSIICAGERCPAKLVGEWSIGRHFYNAYGPTECTVWATIHQCSPSDHDPPIGRPIPGARVYVVDDCGQLCSVGDPGEIWIGGELVGQGYWDRAGLTATAFRKDPFREAKGARIYCTGDRARWSEQGELEFMGRMDRQVKVRGYRIELSEIEVTLEQMPGVTQAAVFLVDLANGPNLAAYMVAAPDVNVNSIRTQLAALMPRHSLPAHLRVVAAFPQSPNGKTDYTRLASELTKAETAADAEGPSGDMESRLAAIWQEILNCKVVSRHDDFFALGGHSLLVARLAGRIREVFGVDLPLKVLFEEPVLREMAAKLESSSNDKSSEKLIPRATRTPVQFAKPIPTTGQDRGQK